MPKWHVIEDTSEYDAVVKYMESLVESVINQSCDDTIILTEHYDVITVGTGTQDSELPDNVAIIRSGRGGKITFHGIGQRVIYPILDLRAPPWNKDIKKYINFLHSWIISTLDELDIKSYTRNDHRGVWTYRNRTNSDAKIAAIGVRAKKWVAYHGVAVNLYTDLDAYKNFIPCGIHDLGVTSAKECGKIIEFKMFDTILKKNYYTEKAKIQ